MASNVIPFPRQPARNRAIAGLYAIEAALSGAGLGFRIDRGSSDEGDPWVSLTDPTDEFIAHVAFIDGEFVADSPAFARVVRTRDIRPLVERLVQGLRDLSNERRSVLDNGALVMAIGLAAAAAHLAHVHVADWRPLDIDLSADLPDHFTIPDALVLHTSARLFEAARDSHVLDLLAPAQPAAAPANHDNPQASLVQHAPVMTHAATQPQAFTPPASTSDAPSPSPTAAAVAPEPSDARPAFILQGEAAALPLRHAVEGAAVAAEAHQAPLVAPQAAAFMSDADLTAAAIDILSRLTALQIDADRGNITVHGVGQAIDQTLVAHDGSTVHIIGVPAMPPHP